MRGFTREELERAKKVDLLQVAEQLGYTPKRVGRTYTLKEMDSIRIYNHVSWYRYSNGTGGSQIDFLFFFANMNVCEAVRWLLEFSGAASTNMIQKSPERKIALEMPKPNKTNHYLLQYLSKERNFSVKVIQWFINQGLIYEEAGTHNIVFVGRDENNVVHQIYKRGTYCYNGTVSDFKCDVIGSDKEHYGFTLYGSSMSVIHVFEAAIDLMSYVDLFQDYEITGIALGCLGDKPLETLLQKNLELHTIVLWLDMDSSGCRAAKEMKHYYEGKGYAVKVMSQKEGCKDMNETLCAIRKEEKRDINGKV